MVYGTGSRGSGLCLLCAEGAESGKKFIVDGPGVIQEGSNHNLDSFNILRREDGSGVWCRGELYLFAICDGHMSMRGMLGFVWV